MVTLVSAQTRRRARMSMPTVSVAGVAWPYDKIALVVAAVLAVGATLVVGGSGELASWIGVAAALVAVGAIRLHYGTAATAHPS